MAAPKPEVAPVTKATVLSRGLVMTLFRSGEPASGAARGSAMVNEAPPPG